MIAGERVMNHLITNLMGETVADGPIRDALHLTIYDNPHRLMLNPNINLLFTNQTIHGHKIEDVTLFVSTSFTKDSYLQ